MHVNISGVSVMKIVPDSFRCCLATGWGAKAISYNTRSFTSTWPLYNEDSRALGQAALRGRGESPSGDIPYSRGCVPVSPAQGDSPLSGGWPRWSPEIHSNPNDFVIWCSSCLVCVLPISWQRRAGVRLPPKPGTVCCVHAQGAVRLRVYSSGHAGYQAVCLPAFSGCQWKGYIGVFCKS